MNKSGKLVIAGAGEIGRLAYEYFTYDSDYDVAAFAAHSSLIREKTVCGLPVVALEEVENIYPPDDFDAFVAIGSAHLNRDRTKIFRQIREKGYRAASYVSSQALIWRNAEIGENCFILGASIMQPFSKIGDNVTMWYKSNIGHSAVVEDNCFFASAGIAGFTHVGENCFLGGGTVVADEVKIARDNFIGMGSVITKSTKENSIYKGNPAVRVKDFTASFFCGVGEE